MKKRILAVFLALALCMGLAVPAFASSEAASSAPDVNIRLPNGDFSEPSTATYPLRRTSTTALTMIDNTSGARTTVGYLTARSVEPTDYALTAITLPLGTTLTISNLRNDWKGQDGQVDIVTVEAYSDPDGDGVYDQWIYDFTGDPPVAPFTEDRIAYPVSENGRYYGRAHLTKDNKFSLDTDNLPGAVTVTTDYLNEVFGPNTLVVFTVQVWTAISTDPLNALPTDTNGTVACFLTGEKAAGTPDAPSFSDVPGTQWYAGAVNWAVENEVTNGTGDGKFSPGQDCTQEQILTFLYRAARGGGTAASAADMAAAVDWAREKGMIDDSFNGKALCTRSTAVSYIWQALGKKAAGASGFTDVPAGAAYAKAVDWAVEIGVTDGTGNGKFSPGKVCDRGTIVTFLYRAYVPSARLK